VSEVYTSHPRLGVPQSRTAAKFFLTAGRVPGRSQNSRNRLVENKRAYPSSGERYQGEAKRIRRKLLRDTGRNSSHWGCLDRAERFAERSGCVAASFPTFFLWWL